LEKFSHEKLDRRSAKGHQGTPEYLQQHIKGLGGAESICIAKIKIRAPQRFPRLALVSIMMPHNRFTAESR